MLSMTTEKMIRKNRETMSVIIIYLFNDNLATGGSLTGAILSRYVEL